MSKNDDVIKISDVIISIFFFNWQTSSNNTFMASFMSVAALEHKIRRGDNFILPVPEEPYKAQAE